MIGQLQQLFSKSEAKVTVEDGRKRVCESSVCYFVILVKCMML